MDKIISWLHVSDIHFASATGWRDNHSRGTLLTYLKELFKGSEVQKPDLIFCTGDIAFGELKSDSLSAQYESARVFFDELRSVCGEDGSPLPLDRLFIVPGNHDIDRSKVNKHAQLAYSSFAKQSQQFSQDINSQFDSRSTEFRDAVRRLSAYEEFVKSYLPHQHDVNGRLQYALECRINDITVGVAGFNSAWTCAGDEDDRNLWLAAEWQFNAARNKISGSDIKIGLIHHPSDWLVLCDRDISNTRIPSEYDFWLHGHSHNAWVSPGNTHVVIAAGAVGAETSAEFGINITTVNLSRRSCATNLHAKKSGASNWTNAPVADHAPTGKWEYQLPTRVVAMAYSKGYCQDQREHNTSLSMPISISQSNEPGDEGLVLRYFSRRLDESLRSFSTHPNKWVDRTISEVSEVSKDVSSAKKIDIGDIIKNPLSALIKAPPQYGLTCLAHYITVEAWKQRPSQLFLYLDARTLQPHKHSVNQAVSDELQLLGRRSEEIKCVILDSFNDDKNTIKILEIVNDLFSNVALIVMQQINPGNFSITQLKCAGRTFTEYYLWALSRNIMRNIVATYNESRVIGDEDVVTARLANDLEVLNLHRTPLNCITLLKVSEFDFDESPVNRCDIIRRVLFLLFNVDALPSYKSRPDLKDCEFVLGYFCEGLIRENKFLFARDKFLVDVQAFCRANLIDLETHSVFDILFQNNIIVSVGHFFRFRFSYWVYYFAAHRMHHDREFAKFILEEMRYSLYPELIEFYTGIDRRREDALSILTNDLKTLHQKVDAHLGLPSDINPYKFAIWKPSEAVVTQMEEELANGVKDSNLPTIIKDQYADKSYDKQRPYNQEINKVLHDHTFVYMLSAMSAGARALRNSDYAAADVKKTLMQEILNCWRQATKVLFVLLPLLAKNGYALYDGIGFALGDGFGEEENERFMKILTCIPGNIATWTRDDIYSRKMGPLLIDQLNRKDLGEIERHELILTLVLTRPRDWEKAVQRYIAECARNSFYLMDLNQALRHQYSVGYISDKPTLAAVEFLIKMSITKHLTGERQPTQKSFKKIKGDILPERLGDRDEQ
ncbi:metallophosphoesterase [Massilia sp. 9I]|uniref:metallophosphoesterase family protein n=1 Tax=Massilia sp. 9I TaxID=2653152 RepID=UPI0012F3534E|nr:metallophosphoesterase [Massilia sp. 9I]VXB04648.1 Calcineurin-like phosphoesterase [Massilia sp. 9I]